MLRVVMWDSDLRKVMSVLIGIAGLWVLVNEISGGSAKIDLPPWWVFALGLCFLVIASAFIELYKQESMREAAAAADLEFVAQGTGPPYVEHMGGDVGEYDDGTRVRMTERFSNLRIVCRVGIRNLGPNSITAAKVFITGIEPFNAVVPTERTLRPARANSDDPEAFVVYRDGAPTGFVDVVEAVYYGPARGWVSALAYAAPVTPLIPLQTDDIITLRVVGGRRPHTRAYKLVLGREGAPKLIEHPLDASRQRLP